MNAQLQARDFYLKLGYSPFGNVFLEENIKHISMNKFYKSIYILYTNLAILKL